MNRNLILFLMLFLFSLGAIVIDLSRNFPSAELTRVKTIVGGITKNENVVQSDEIPFEEFPTSPWLLNFTVTR